MNIFTQILTLLTEPFGYAFFQRALLSCALIGFTNGFLGTFIILRRQALLADALSHSLLPGLAVAAILVGLSPCGLLLGGLVAALLVALGGQLMARNSRLKDETAITSLYIIAFAIGIVLIRFAKVKVDLTHFLFGNILGVGNGDLWVSYAAAFPFCSSSSTPPWRAFPEYALDGSRTDSSPSQCWAWSPPFRPWVSFSLWAC